MLEIWIKHCMAVTPDRDSQLSKSSAMLFFFDLFIEWVINAINEFPPLGLPLQSPMNWAVEDR